MDRIRRAAEKLGGRLERTADGYELLAPEGMRWTAFEVWCQPLPVRDADTAEERNDIWRIANECVAGGVEKAG